MLLGLIDENNIIFAAVSQISTLTQTFINADQWILLTWFSCNCIAFAQHVFCVVKRAFFIASPQLNLHDLV